MSKEKVLEMLGDLKNLMSSMESDEDDSELMMDYSEFRKHSLEVIAEINEHNPGKNRYRSSFYFLSQISDKIASFNNEVSGPIIADNAIRFISEHKGLFKND